MPTSKTSREHQPSQQPTPWGLLIPPDPNNAKDAVTIPIPRRIVGAQQQLGNSANPTDNAEAHHPHLRTIHLAAPLREELHSLCKAMFELPVADRVGGRAIVAINDSGEGWYGYGATKHECVKCPYACAYVHVPPFMCMSTCAHMPAHL